MSTRFTPSHAVALASLALAGVACYSLRAQDAKAVPGQDARREDAPSVHEALRHRFDFTFKRPTSIESAAKVLGERLRFPVVLDRAAFDRAGLKADDEVQLELTGVRLKTGLRLLLDQLDLTYRVEEEDNLLVITDRAGASDPLLDVVAQLKSLHKDVHDLQDAMDEVEDALGITADDGPKMRKPTIIEEVPAEGNAKDKPLEAPKVPPARSRPGL